MTDWAVQSVIFCPNTTRKLPNPKKTTYTIYC